MKKFTFIFIMLLAFAGITRAQVIEDFEHIPLNYMVEDTSVDHSSMSVVANPDPSGINTSATVIKFVRDKDGVPYGGFWSSLTTPVDITTNKYVHVKVWKPRISPIKFKLEGGAAGYLEIASMIPQATIGAWEDIVFDFTSKTGTYPILAFMPDFEEPLTLTADIIIYFDDIIVNNDPLPATAAAYVIEDFERIGLNVMLGGIDDLSSMEVMANPYPSGINTSGTVVKFIRDKDGVPWGGFWSALTDSIDVTTNKYMHVKVWKPRISPIRFKVEGGAAGNLEQVSKYPQTSKGVWEDIVIDFSTKTGKYKVIAFMPDFVDPLGITDDIEMYFDDIMLNNDPMPFSDTTLSLVSFRVNMSQQRTLGNFDPKTEFVDLAGTFNDWGSGGSAYHLTPEADSNVYYITVPLITGQAIEFKFRINSDWANAEFFGGGNRTYTVGAGTNVYNCWYDVVTTSPVITLGVNMSYWESKGLFDPATEFVDLAGDFTGWGATIYKLSTTDQMVYQTTFIPDSLFAGDVIQFKFRINSDWNNSEFPNGGDNRTYTIKVGINDTTYWYNDSIPSLEGIPEVNLKDYVTLYPNPFSEVLNINTTAEISNVLISNYLGQQIARYEKMGIGQVSVNTSGLKKGIYLVTFYSKNGGQFTQKLIKN